MVYYISDQFEVGRTVHGLDALCQLYELDEVYMDTENDGLDPYTLKPILLGLTDGNDNYYIVNLLSTDKKALQQKLEPIADKAVWVAHNMKYDYKMLYAQLGIKLEKVWCTMVASQVLYNGMNKLGHNIADCLERHFGVKVDKSVRNSFINRNLDQPITDAEINYLVDDLKYLKPLKERQVDRAKKTSLELCLALENEFLPVLADMELEGVVLDTQKWSSIGRKFRRQALEYQEKLVQEINRLAMLFPNLLDTKVQKATAKKKPLTKYDLPNQFNMFDQATLSGTISKDRVLNNININSTAQIQAIYNRCGAEDVMSTGEAVLQNYLLLNPDGALAYFTELLLAYRGLQKLITTYGDNFFEFINPVTGKIHSDFSQCFTDTGRLSSSKPNLQNVAPGPNGALRACFVPDSEEYTFVDVDMSGQELRVAASYSQDKMLKASFNEGLDLHSFLAQASYRIIKNDPTLIVSKTENKDLRNKHKPILFSVLYGGSAGGIASKLGIDKDIAKRVYQSILNNLPELNRFQQEFKRKALAQLEVRDGSKYNRVKYFNKFIKEEQPDHSIERQSVNFPIQSSSAAMMKEAGIVLNKYFKDNNLDAKIKMAIHDQYIIQIRKDDADWLGLKIKEIMEDVGTSYLHDIKMESELNINPFWSH